VGGCDAIGSRRRFTVMHAIFGRGGGPN
jgi:hypothetical protein